MATRIHLVRHAEVDNPRHLVYADLPGYDLSPTGRDQARAAARYLGRRPVVAVWSSPLLRALRTAEVIANRLDLSVRVEEALTEWELMNRWRGVSWEDLPVRFPGELEAFLSTPGDLPFSPESLEEMTRRVTATIRGLDDLYPHGELVVVTHQAPVQAAILGLSGTPLSSFWDGRPGHASVTTLKGGPGWGVETAWEPEQG